MIREISKEDNKIFLQLVEEFYCSDAVLHSIPKTHIEKTFDTIISGSPYTKGFIIEKEGQVAGYCLVSITYSNEAGGLVLLIEEIFILQEYRGLGLGTELFNFLKEKFNEGFVRFRLEACEGNKDALRLYRKIGFEKLDYLQMILE